MVSRFMADGGEFGGSEKDCYRALADRLAERGPRPEPEPCPFQVAPPFADLAAPPGPAASRRRLLNS